MSTNVMIVGGVVLGVVLLVVVMQRRDEPAPVFQGGQGPAPQPQSDLQTGLGALGAAIGGFVVGARSESQRESQRRRDEANKPGMDVGRTPT